MTTEQDIRNQIEYGSFEGLEEGFAKGEAKGLAKGRKEGREEGLAEGEAKGRNAERIAMAKKMLEAGIPCGQIMSITGLSEEEVRKI